MRDPTEIALSSRQEIIPNFFLTHFLFNQNLNLKRFFSDRYICTENIRMIYLSVIFFLFNLDVYFLCSGSWINSLR